MNGQEDFGIPEELVSLCITELAILAPQLLRADVDLEILGVQKSASKTEIKKAYHKAALASHPDKVAVGDRSAAEVKFKSVSKAYEILYDDDKRQQYDTLGTAAFDAGHGHGPGMDSEVDLEEMFQYMFGMGGGVPPGSPGTGPRKGRKGADEEHPYQVTLEELYKGKTTKFASKKNVICSHCKGGGGRDKAKPKQCGSCQGRGSKQRLRAVAGFFTQETVLCNSCKGGGTIFKDRDRCKKCKGERVTEARKVLEIYIPRGSKGGDKIVLEGEADQVPEQDPGDIIFNIVEIEHGVFRRAGADLSADLEITLAEAVCGFSRVVIKHLDGRGLHMNHRQPGGGVLNQGQVVKIVGEGMPHKKSELRGDLYMIVHIKFPDDGWLQDEERLAKLRDLLPKTTNLISADTVDEVEYDQAASIDDYGASAPDGEAWEDDDEDEADVPSCNQQ